MALVQAGGINSHQSEDGIDRHWRVRTQPVWSRTCAVVVKGERLIGAEPKSEEVGRPHLRAQWCTTWVGTGATGLIFLPNVLLKALMPGA